MSDSPDEFEFPIWDNLLAILLGLGLLGVLGYGLWRWI
jgi:hypothetical protein